MMKHTQTNGNGTPREHETLESQLRDLMAHGEKARGERDKLAGKLAEKDAEIVQIAAAQVELTSTLAGLYRKHAGGKR